FLCDGELLRIAGESDDRGTAPKELRVLDGIAAESTDAENPDHPIWAEGAGIAELLDAAVGRHPRIGERRELLGLQATADLDQIASRNGNELREAAIWPEPRPTHVGTDVRIADLAVTAGAIAPARCDDDVVALAKSRRLGDDLADLVHHAGDFVAQRDGRRDV